MLANDEIVPVVMFHSVGLAETEWCFSHISEPLERFEEKIAHLSRAGYQFLFWSDLYEHMSGRRKISGKSVMLTFDDGYLDNWVFVYPLLKKYGAKGTIFVNPEFVDESSTVRSTMDDVAAGKVSAASLKNTGFLSWAEMRIMEASGLVDIQSHSLTHTWYYSGPEVKDFHRPGDNRYPWLAWNTRPERKPYYMAEDQSGFVPPGTPVYAHEKALVCKRYFPPSGVMEKMVDFVRDHGGADFFLKEGWKVRLCQHHAELMEKYRSDGRTETEEEYEQRIFCELTESRRRIEEHLKKKVEYICWPGGGYQDIVLTLAKKAGYRAWTLASRDQSNFRNSFGAGPKQVKRVGSFTRYQIPGGVPLGYAGSLYFICGIERHRGSLFHSWLGRTLLGAAHLRSVLRL